MSTTSPPSHSGNPSPVPPAPRRRTWRRFFVGLGLALLIMLVVVGSGLAGAEYYTGQPNFCGSCHVMDPYYESWSHDLHGKKVGAKCIDCHYAPGERFTIKAKFKGLSQVASYFSGRYGAGRPRAHVADESCLRSSCHGDGEYMSKMLPIGEPRPETRLIGDQSVEVMRTPTVNFFHEKHLQIDAKRTDNQAKLARLEQQLKSALSPEVLARVLTLAKSVTPAADRHAALERLTTELRLSDDLRAAARELIDAEHRQIRLEQLGGLNCSSCHNFDPSLKNHLAVERQACYTCHFTNEAFNHATGACLSCHQAPTRSILVHERPTGTAVQPVLMDHQDIVKKNVDCASCHADVVREDARVSERLCSNCHDQAKYLEEFASRTTDTVRKYHVAHVHEQRARCQDCHRAVQHGLLDPQRLAGTAEFLQPVLRDCQHCHPGHHTEQVVLLTGSGGAGLPHSTPNAMLGSRLNCRACHTQSDVDDKGEHVLVATQSGCAACHSDDYLKLFDQWKSEIATYLKESQARLSALSQRVEQQTAAGTRLPDSLLAGLADARQNVHIVAAGNGIHNRHYALQLLDTARLKLDELEKGLGRPMAQ